MMRPELINRIDKIIVFRALTKSEITRILDLQLKELNDRLVRQGLAVKLSEPAKKHLVEEGYDPQNGVRPMRRLLQDTIEDEISNGLLSGEYTKGTVINIGTKNGKLVFEGKKETAAVA
jgi:ATP-dependent Clp protease ATP-binding subunit ClpC